MSWAVSRRTLTLAVIFFVLCACDIGREPLPCECPELEAALTEVDWAPGLSIRFIESGRNSSMEVVVIYDGEGRGVDALEARAIQAMDLSGYEISELSGGAMEGRFQDLTILVSQSSELSADSHDLRIAIKFDGSDGTEARDQLATLRDRLMDG